MANTYITPDRINLQFVSYDIKKYGLKNNIPAHQNLSPARINLQFKYQYIPKDMNWQFMFCQSNIYEDNMFKTSYLYNKTKKIMIDNDTYTTNIGKVKVNVNPVF